MSNSKPKLFDYLNAHAFLTDYFHYRKSLQAGFSYDAWAAELGFKSRSYLRMILIGRKKITRHFIENFVRYERFTALEISYFEILVQYTQAKSKYEKQNYGHMLMKALKATLGQEEISDHIDFVAQPLLPRLLVLLSFEDIPTEPKILSFLLNSTRHEIEAALTTLAHLNLAENFDENGSSFWRSKKNMFKVPDQLGSAPLAKFHEQSLLEAIQAFSLPKETRKYKSLLLPLTADEFQTLNQMLNEFTSDAIARFRSNLYEGRQVFQLNFNVFPVTQRIESGFNKRILTP